MPSHDFDRLLAPAVSAVLETMFFAEPSDLPAPDPDAANLEARVAFSGEISGVLGVRISQAGARTLAASFLGDCEECLTDTQIEQVVCELANMLCGWIISKPEFRGCFDLGPPELVSVAGEHLGMPDFQQGFTVENGTLVVSLYSSVPV